MLIGEILWKTRVLKSQVSMDHLRPEGLEATENLDLPRRQVWMLQILLWYLIFMEFLQSDCLSNKASYLQDCRLQLFIWQHHNMWAKPPAHKIGWIKQSFLVVLWLNLLGPLCYRSILIEKFKDMYIENIFIMLGTVILSYKIMRQTWLIQNF